MPTGTEAPQGCLHYMRPRREDVVKLCAVLGGARHLAVKNVVELTFLVIKYTKSTGGE